MPWFEVTYMEDGELVIARVKASGKAAAEKKAGKLIPDGAHLTTKKLLESGPKSMRDMFLIGRKRKDG